VKLAEKHWEIASTQLVKMPKEKPKSGYALPLNDVKYLQ
jgi:hypothetical protein